MIGTQDAKVGNIDVVASSTADIDATINAISGSLSFGSSSGVAVALGVSVARNFMGWSTDDAASGDYDTETGLPQGQTLTSGQTVRLSDGVRAGDVYEYLGPDLVQDSVNPIDLRTQDYSDHRLWKQVNVTPVASEVQAYIEDSTIHASGAVTADANADQKIDSIVLAGAVAIAGGGDTGVGVSGAGVYTENRLEKKVKAFIDGGIDDDSSDVIDAASVVVTATDSSRIEADAGAASVAAAFGSTSVAVSIGVAAAYNTITNDVAAFIDNIDSTDVDGDITIQALSVPASSPIGGDYVSASGVQTIQEGDLVEVSAGHTEGGTEGRIYQYRGYADFLSTDGGKVDDLATDGDDSYVLHLLTGSLIAEVDSDGNKTGRVFELVEGDHDEDNPIVVGETQTIDDILDRQLRQRRALR